MERLLPSVFLLSAGLLAAPSPAQTCGPLDFTFALTGPGCPAGSAGPQISASVLPAPAPCGLRFTFLGGMAGFAPGGAPASLFLILGTSNPMLSLAPIGLGGCTAWASPDVILPMPTQPNFTTPSVLDVPVPPDPAFVGVTVYTQGLVMLAAFGFVYPDFSWGTSVAIS